MDRFIRCLAVTASAAFLIAVPAQAQTGSGSFGIHGAWANPGDHAEGPQESVGFDETFGPGAELEFWFGDSKRVGLGLQGSWAGWNEWDTDLRGGDFGHPVDMYHYDASLQFRLTTPDLNTRFVPFLSIGGGGITVNPDDEDAFDGSPTFDFPEADVRLDTETHTEWAVVGGLGADIFLNRSLALRLEAKDYWTPDSPYLRLSNGEAHDGGHNILLTAGLQFFWGAEGVQEPGFIQEEPEPEPEPMPEPEPEPVTERVMMCVVGDDGELETVEATRYVETDRLVVRRNGTEVSFNNAYPATSPRYVRGASWYMNDEPVTVRLRTTDTDVDVATDIDADTDISRLEFVRFGSPSTMSASGLMYVGSVNGSPVYVQRRDLGTMTTRLNTALANQDDLGVILRNDAELAREFSDLETFYMAVEPGCVFQPVSLTTYVRATRG